jgi:hypothetical protein
MEDVSIESRTESDFTEWPDLTQKIKACTQWSQIHGLAVPFSMYGACIIIRRFGARIGECT